MTKFLPFEQNLSIHNLQYLEYNDQILEPIIWKLEKKN